jgi:1,4-alpha-glucan branching enzyme
LQRLVIDLNGAYRADPAMWADDFSPDGFGWIDANDSAGNVVSFLRFSGAAVAGTDPAAAAAATGPADGIPDSDAASGGDAGTAVAGSGAAGGAVAGSSTDAGRLDGSVVACVANFAGGPHLTYRIGLPHAGRWREVINTDATAYGGSGVGNLGVIEAIPEPWHGRPASAVIAVPPLGVLWLAPENPAPSEPPPSSSPSPEPGPPPAPAEG